MADTMPPSAAAMAVAIVSARPRMAATMSPSSPTAFLKSPTREHIAAPPQVVGSKNEKPWPASSQAPPVGASGSVIGSGSGGGGGAVIGPAGSSMSLPVMLAILVPQ